jgi:hypothetical protein
MGKALHSSGLGIHRSLGTPHDTTIRLFGPTCCSSGLATLLTMIAL